MRRRLSCRSMPVFTLLFSAAVATADVPLSVDDPGTSAAVPRLSAGTCVLEPGPRSGTSLVWISPDDYSNVYWRIPACASCPAGENLQLDSLSFRVRWFGACTAHVRVSVVGTIGTGNCSRPDTTHALCSPSMYTITGTGSVGIIHSLALPTGCCVPSGSFLRVEFLDLASCDAAGSLSPGLTIASNTCTACEQFYQTTVTHPGITEWCTPDSAGSNPIWLHLVADCCATTGVDDAPPPTAAGIAMLRNFALPIRMGIRLAGTGVRRVDVDVFDVAGRHVRTLLRDEVAGGEHILEWDGRSDSGGRLRPGVYEVRLRDDSRLARATAILVD